MYQTTFSPVVVFLQTKSGLPSPLKSPTPVICQWISLTGGREANPSHIHPVHVPDDILTGRAIPPDQVGIAVTVKIAYPGYLPVDIAHRGEIGPSGHIHPVHVPDRHSHRSWYSSRPVGIAVTVKIAHPGYLPVDIAHRGKIGQSESNSPRSCTRRHSHRSCYSSRPSRDCRHR